MPPTKRAPKRAPARKTPAKRKPPGRATRTATRKPAAKRARSKPAAKFGPPGTAGKAEGDAPVRAYLEALPPHQREIGLRVDAVIEAVVPGVKRAIKWSMPFYGVEGKGWFAAFAPHKNHCAVRFFQGTQLSPPLPASGGKGMRSVNYSSVAGLDEKALAAWVEQAASIPGWGA